jgi:18S rRNA (guanine1575-N7)-methyltransferase
MLIAQCASAVGFMGGLVVDYPNSSKAKKYYLCLGFDHGYKAPAGRTAEEGAGGVKFTAKSAAAKRRGPKGQTPREWVLAKKEKRRNANKETRRDTKYTARKRKDKF